MKGGTCLLKNIEFKYPSNILFLILAVTAIIFFILSFRKKDKILTALNISLKARFKILKTLLLLASLSLLVFSLLGPQEFSGYKEVSKEGLDIYVLMDTSKSMLVTDIAPDRIAIAKKIVGKVLDNLSGDRIGIIPFASDAYIQMPLTDDYQLAKMFLDVLDTDMIGGGGTNLAAAIRLASDSFDRTSSADRVILILSDGEEHDDASLDIIKSITDDRLKIYTVGVGTEKGGLVPVYNDAGDSIIDYIRDETNNPVTSRLNASTLKKLALDGHGSYYQATLQGNETTELLEELSKLQKDTYEMEKIKSFKPLYQYFLGASLLLFMIAWFLPERRITR